MIWYHGEMEQKVKLLWQEKQLFNEKKQVHDFQQHHNERKKQTPTWILKIVEVVASSSILSIHVGVCFW